METQQPSTLAISTTESAARESGMRILYIDDDADALSLLADIISELADASFLGLLTPKQAVETARTFQPTVIIIDKMFPDSDGLHLLKALRRDQQLAEIPAIIISNSDEATEKVNSFACGANDYLVKFPDPRELIARLRYHSDVYYRQKQLDQLQNQLQLQQQHLLNDLNFAASIQKEMLTPIPQINYLDIALKHQPQGIVTGDYYCFWHTSQQCSLFIGDATGHGIAAAFLTIMARMAISDLDNELPVEEVTFEVNRALQKNTPGGLYLASLMLQIDNNGILSVCAAGHPPLMIMSNKGALREIKSTHLPLGLRGIQQDFKSQSLQLHTGDKIIIFTDGIFDWENAQGARFGLDAVRTHLQEHHSLPPQLLTDSLYQAAEQFSASYPACDDITLVVIE